MNTNGKSGLLYQMYILIVLSLAIISIGIYISQQNLSNDAVNVQTEQYMNQVSAETRGALEEYPAHEWLVRYWYEHADDLDIEYDVDYGAGTETEKKAAMLSEHQPQLQLKYAETEELEGLPAKDQKLYAEVTYSWLMTRLNEIKRSNKMNFLFILVTDTEEGAHPYETQTFILSAADPGAKRGTKYEEVYTLGHRVSIADNESQQTAMREAVKNSGSKTNKGYKADAGKYVDYYSYVGELDDKAIIIGLTRDFSQLHDAIHEKTVDGTAYALVYQIILLAIILLLAYLLMLRPLKKLLASIREYTSDKDRNAFVGKLNGIMKGIILAVNKNNEIGQLTRDMNELADEMDDHIHEIQVISEERKRIEVELELASRIQVSMMPNTFPAFPNRSEVDLYASMTPAREVGGDFYDFFMLDDDHLAIAIGDVSGKSIPAALFMVASKSKLHDMCVSTRSPAQVLEAVNDQISKDNREEMFVTVWLGILRISTGKLVCANAGHEYPAIKRADGHFELLKDKHGFVLGGLGGMKYTDYEIAMEPGEKVFVYTDGLPEATNKDNEMLGADRMIETLREYEDALPEDILISVKQAVSDFTGEAEQFDDLTMLCIEYKGSSN